MLSREEKILSLSKKYVTAVLENEDAAGFCFTICYTLCLHLYFNGFTTLIKSGIVNGTTPHYLLTLPDNEEIFIDPTIRQFFKDKDIVHVGEKPQTYGEFEKFDFYDVYETWLYPLLNNGLVKPLPSIIEQKRKFLDLSRLLNVNIRAAALLFCENEKGKPEFNNGNSEMIQLYFAAIDKMILANRSNKKLVNSSLHRTFDELAFNATRKLKP
jgi:hypothetical protein